MTTLRAATLLGESPNCDKINLNNHFCVILETLLLQILLDDLYMEIPYNMTNHLGHMILLMVSV